MFETTIRFKPKDQWRAGMTQDKLIDQLDKAVKVPGLANFWIPPIRNRIEMLSTGIKSPIGIKVAGANLAEIDAAAREIEQVAKTVPGVGSALAERLTGGRYIDVDINRAAAARYGLNVADVQSIVSGAIGGETIGQTVEGLARYPISVRYPRELRDSIEGLRSSGRADAGRAADHARHRRRRSHHRWTADATQRERPAGDVDLHRWTRRAAHHHRS